MTLLDQALAYAARGWPVFPLQPKDKRPIPGSHGFKEATTNPNLIERWWDRTPDANIGVATGSTMKVWVLDIDGPEGAASLTQLEEELGPLPDTLDGQTGGGGRHLYFACPEGRTVTNRSNLRAGVDVRGEGGYVVAPPSIHPSGRAYAWTVDDKQPILYAPKKWVDFVAPPKAPTPAPWERVDPRPAPTSLPPTPLLAGGRLPLAERARLYLREVDPAVQGSGGHNALLWAARCLVVGFELDADTALQLLWSEYNPRCVPPWNAESEVDRKDFERKVRQAKDTPAGKRPGWLLDEFGLRGVDEQARAIGETSAAALLASAQKRAEVAPETIVAPEPKKVVAPPPVGERRPFPIEHFPDQVRSFVLRVSESHNVDTSFAGLPALAVAGAAMGNAWRLELKRGFVVPPILWVCLVAPNGQNKSGPLKAVLEPLRRTLTPEQIVEPLLNPQGRVVVSDATLEAVVQRLSEGRRGLLNFRDELAGWINSFGQFKKGGGADEQAWLEFWGGSHYTVDRKTLNEQIHIPAASVSVLGGIQPATLVKCFDPARFASGFVPRILVACPPRRTTFWNEHEVDPEAERLWEDAVSWLRCTPFVGVDTTNGTMLPRVVQLLDKTPQKTVWLTCFDSFTAQMDDPALDENARGFLSKARVQAGRLALIHHGLRLACGDRNLTSPLAVESVEAGASWARWCLEEQLRVYGFGSVRSVKVHAEELAIQIREKLPTKSATARQVMRLNARRYDEVSKATAAMGQLVELGHARWEDATRNKVILNEVKP